MKRKDRDADDADWIGAVVVVGGAAAIVVVVVVTSVAVNRWVS